MGCRGWTDRVRTAPALAVGLSGIALLLAGCSASPSTFSLEPIESSAPFSGSAPRLASAHGRTLLSWIDRSAGVSTFQFAERTVNGWSGPRTIASGADLLVNSADVPSVLALGDGSLAAHWMVERGTGPEAYDIRIAWSRDDGATWSAPLAPHHDNTDTQHGFVSLFEPSPASLGLLWLDGRATAPAVLTPIGHGDMALRSTVFDPARVQDSEVVVDARVCECCPTSAAAIAEGIVAAYRGRSAANVRDIHIARLVDGSWSAPATVHDDGWTLSACPVNGPSVDARGADVVVGWFTLREAEGRAFVAFSSDAGRTFGPPLRVDEESARGRLQVALLDDGSAAVGWIEYADRQSQWRVRRVRPDGSRSASVVVAGGMGTQHPRMVRGEGELLLAWVESGAQGPVVRTARAAY